MFSSWFVNPFSYSDTHILTLYGEYKYRRKVGKKINSKGVWVDDYKLFYGKNKSEAEAKFAAFMDNLNKGITNKPLHFGQLVLFAMIHHSFF